MELSFISPKSVYPVYDGTIHITTRITSKHEPVLGESLCLYYKRGLRASCLSCLNAKLVTGKKCPIYDPKTYSKDIRCPAFWNIIQMAKITKIERYNNYQDIPDKEEWAKAQGYSTVEEATAYFLSFMGKGWDLYPLTIISWERKTIL